ncbi:hypothetical protein TNCV_1314751 [Trichonephila clavipes]|uniref:Uncharacterized protein n=1 Tax=Trichonephila clavipes TaxID=2585209 RepID=A0A8X6SU19_TRICX|nr:hypothetical protein TNCV_1314751 [Trichonephila clavipes]
MMPVKSIMGQNPGIGVVMKFGACGNSSGYHLRQLTVVQNIKSVAKSTTLECDVNENPSNSPMPFSPQKLASGEREGVCIKFYFMRMSRYVRLETNLGSGRLRKDSNSAETVLGHPCRVRPSIVVEKWFLGAVA